MPLSYPDQNSNNYEIGVDEVGRGSLAGPVVAAAAILSPYIMIEGLADSKKLNVKKRKKVEAIIKQRAIAWEIGLASPEEIDRYNILQATFLAMHRALDKLLIPSIPPPLLLIDGKYFKPYKGYKHQTIIQGDSKIASIAAASIIAKTYRDRWMHKQSLDYPAYGWSSNVGYPTQSHRHALALHGPTPLHRRSFKWFKTK